MPQAEGEDDVPDRPAHPAIRDLAWAIGSPALISPSVAGGGVEILDDAFFSRALAAAKPWLEPLAETPEPLLSFLASHPSRRLGRYLEALIQFWLQQAPEFSLVAANVPVHAQGRTHGEFDLLLRDAAGQLQHWEVAGKFYLGIGDTRDPDNWLGPNPEDRLSEKLTHLLTHQARLGQNPAALPLLRRMGLEKPLPRAFLKGYLFYPLEQWLADDCRPPRLAGPAHGRGFWLHERQLSELLASRPAAERIRWLILPRQRWLSPASSPAMAEVLDEDSLGIELRAHFQQRGQPLLLAGLVEKEGLWQEVCRGFVLANRWPGTSGPLP